jgi:hypothetical protein
MSLVSGPTLIRANCTETCLRHCKNPAAKLSVSGSKKHKTITSLRNLAWEEWDLEHEPLELACHIINVWGKRGQILLSIGHRSRS